MYVFVRQDLPLEDQFIQSNHAVFHLALKHAGITGVPNLIGIGVPNVKSLCKVLAKLEENFISHYAWHEPDDNMGFTAIATVPLRGAIRDVLANYRLWKYRWSAVSDCTGASKALSAGGNPAGPAMEGVGGSSPRLSANPPPTLQ